MCHGASFAEALFNELNQDQYVCCSIMAPAKGITASLDSDGHKELESSNFWLKHIPKITIPGALILIIGLVLLITGLSRSDHGEKSLNLLIPGGVFTVLGAITFLIKELSYQPNSHYKVITLPDFEQLTALDSSDLAKNKSIPYKVMSKNSYKQAISSFVTPQQTEETEFKHNEIELSFPEAQSLVI